MTQEPKVVVVPKELYYHEVEYVRGLEAEVERLSAEPYFSKELHEEGVKALARVTWERDQMRADFNNELQEMSERFRAVNLEECAKLYDKDMQAEIARLTEERDRLLGKEREDRVIEQLWKDEAVRKLNEGRAEIARLTAQIEEFKTEREYVWGFNAGFDEAKEQYKLLIQDAFMEGLSSGLGMTFTDKGKEVMWEGSQAYAALKPTGEKP